jgi:mannose-6-phosphate isomerase-like protein (cupin superfamily)
MHETALVKNNSTDSVLDAGATIRPEATSALPYGNTHAAQRVHSVERVSRSGVELAIILRADHEQDGIGFFTPSHYSQQLGYMRHPAGHRIPPHVHNSVPRAVTFTSEVLFVKSGRLRVDFYDQQHEYVESRVLTAGDVVLLASGGHGFRMLEPTELIEVKQGPYVGDGDKSRFEPVADDRVRLRE